MSNLDNVGKFSVYPNPAKNHVTIHSGFLFRNVEIFNTNGQRVFYSRRDKSESLYLDFNLTHGLYLMKISDMDKFASSKLIIEL